MFNMFQILAFMILIIFWNWHKYNLQSFYYASVVWVGFISGLIMGDIKTGMLIGGEMCLMSLGLVGIGGSSVPNYHLGCIAGSAFAIALGQSGQTALGTAMAIGVPVAALGVQLDVLGKTSGSFFIHRSMQCSDKEDWKGMSLWFWLGNVVFWAIGTLPLVLLMAFGSEIVESAVNNFPVWLTNGLNVVSGMLPALGIAILMRYLPMKKYGYFLLFGYVLASYMGLDMLPIALMGVVVCVFIFQLLEKQNKMSVLAAGGEDNEDE